MVGRGRRARTDERGASAVELALVLPLLMMVLFGTISFGIVFAQELALSNGAREGARHAVVANRTCGQIEDLARDAATTLAMPAAEVAVTVSRGTSAGTAVPVCVTDTVVPCRDSALGESVFVRLDFESELLIPLVVTDSEFDLSGEGVFRCEFS